MDTPSGSGSVNIIHYKLLGYGGPCHDAWKWVWDRFSSVTMYSYGAAAACLDT